VCRGVPLVAKFNITPAGTPVILRSTNGLFRDTVRTDSIRLLPDRTTTYIATVNANSCSRSDTLHVVVDSLPANLAIMPGDTSVCQGSLVLLTSEIFEPKDFPNIDFKWVPSNGQQTPDSLYNMVVSADTTTRYFRITTSGVCVDSAYADIEVKPIPQITITPSDTTICSGTPVQIRVTTRPDNLEKPMWEPATGLSCMTCLNPTATVSNTTTFTFKGEKDGCPASASVRINVPIPNINLTTRTQLCLGDSVQLNTAPAVPGVVYTWTSSTDPNFRSTNPNLVVRPSQTTTYRLTAQVPGCQPVERQITITIIQVPTIDATADPTTVCRGSAVRLTATSTAPNTVMQTFNWRGNSTIYSGQSLTVENLQATTDFILTYTYGNNCGTLRDTVRVTVIEGGQININPTDTIVCVGQSVQLNATGTAQIVNPRWTMGSGLSCTNCINPTATPTVDSAVYTFTGTLATCPSEITKTVVIRRFPSPAINIIKDTTICAGQSVRLNSNPTPGATYVWTSSTNPNFRSTDPNLSVAPNVTTTYTLTASLAGCAPIVQRVIVTIFTANVTISGDSTLCPGEALSLTAMGNAPAGFPQNYRWQWNQNNNQTGATLNLPNLPGDTEFTLTYTYGTGCAPVIRRVNVDVQTLSVSIEADPDSVFRGQPVTVTATTTPPNLPGATYTWTANDKPIPGNGPTIQHNPTENPTVYKVKVQLNNGCNPDSNSTRVVIKTVNIRLPNAFTPNNDGKNDVFVYITEDVLASVDFKIYNRWGQLVFETREFNKGWDGKHNGRDAPSDVYVYVLVARDPGGNEEIRKGDVTLIR